MGEENPRIDCAPFHIDLWMVTTDTSRASRFLEQQDPGTSVSFKMLGAWDMLTISRPGCRPVPKPGVVLDQGAFEAFPLRPISTGDHFWRFIKAAPVVLVSFIKVHGVFAALGGIESAVLIGKHLASSPGPFGSAQICRVLYTIGSNQLVAFIAVRDWEQAMSGVLDALFLSGKDIPGLLGRISAMRRRGVAGSLEIDRTLRDCVKLEDTLVLAKTRTCLVWRSLERRRNELPAVGAKLGPGDFTMAINSSPTSEEFLAGKWYKRFSALNASERGPGILVSLGTDDLRAPHLVVPDVVSFLDKVARFRGDVGGHMGRLTTTTVPLIRVSKDRKPVSSPVISSPNLRTKLRTGLAALQAKREAVHPRNRPASRGKQRGPAPLSGEPSTREIRDVLIAANAALSDPELASDFVDVHPALEDLSRLIETARKTGFADRWSLHVVRQHANAVSAALSERARTLFRATGQMAGPTFHAYATGPHAYLKTWEIVMNLLFYNVTGESWVGCVVSTQEPGIWHDRTSPILRIPLRMLDCPIPHLLRLSHEAGHLVFDYAIEGSERAHIGRSTRHSIADTIRSFFRDTRWSYPQASARTLASEIFAVWFEYHFCQGKQDLCLKSSWHSWLESELAWENPGELLLRTATMLAADRLSEQPLLLPSRARGSSSWTATLAAELIYAALDYIRRAHVRSRPIPRDLVDRCESELATQRDTLCYLALPLLSAFVEALPLLRDDIRGLSALPGGARDEQATVAAAKAIMSGQVLTYVVPNYLALVSQLAERYLEEPTAPSISALTRANIALSLSLAHVWDVNVPIPLQVRR